MPAKPNLTKMKKTLLSYSFLLASFITASAQEFDKAADYIGFVKKNHKEVYDEVTTYIGKLENGSNISVAETQRRVIVKKSPSIIVSIHGMPSYKGDKSLQDSLAAYLRRTYWLIEKEYPKIQKMQDSAYKSHATALRYASAKKNALNTLIDDERKFYEGLKSFSAKYGVPVPATYDNEYERLLFIKEVANHHTTLQLVYAKCKGQDILLDKAIRTKEKKEMEEHSVMLTKYVKESYTTIDTIKPYKQDKSLIEATRGLLGFYQSESEFKVPILLQLLNSDAEHSRANVQASNPDDIATYPNTLKDLDTDRSMATDKWNKASQAFLKKYLGE